jgi:high-affinity iron transporter
LKLNLGRFFRVTGVFLVLIAAGLVMGALRTAHEAGWVAIGQQQVFDFSAWMPSQSILGALITGMFGLSADPRLVEVLGWLLYAVPVLVVFLWPARLAAAPRIRRRLLAAASAALLIGAALLAITVPAGSSAPGTRARSVTDRLGHTASVSLLAKPDGRSLAIASEAGSSTRSVELAAAGDQTMNGIAVRVWQKTVPADPGPSSPTVTLQDLSSLTGGRLPVGVTLARTPGPFQAQWAATTVYTVLAQGDSVISAQATSNRTAVLTGGGLTGPKIVSVGALPTDWSTASVEDRATAAHISENARERSERQLWKVWLPWVLGALGLACALGAVASGRGDRAGTEQERRSIDGESHRPGTVPIP